MASGGGRRSRAAPSATVERARQQVHEQRQHLTAVHLVLDLFFWWHRDQLEAIPPRVLPV